MAARNDFDWLPGITFLVLLPPQWVCDWSFQNVYISKARCQSCSLHAVYNMFPAGSNEREKRDDQKPGCRQSGRRPREKYQLPSVASMQPTWADRALRNILPHWGEEDGPESPLPGATSEPCYHHYSPNVFVFMVLGSIT